MKEEKMRRENNIRSHAAGRLGKLRKKIFEFIKAPFF